MNTRLILAALLALLMAFTPFATAEETATAPVEASVESREVELQVPAEEALFSPETIILPEIEALNPDIRAFDLTGNAKASFPVGEPIRITLGGETAKSFKTSKARVATVDASGLVTPVGEGKAKITAVLTSGKKRTLTLTVYDPTLPTGIAIAPAGTQSLDLHETLMLTFELSPDTAVSDVTWKSSSKKVAAVSADGLVTPLKAGKTTITATTTRGRQKAKITIVVEDRHAPTGVALPGAPAAMTAGQSIALIPVASAKSEPAITTYSWKTSSKKVATVDSNGVVTALKPGKVKITVTTANKKKATVAITVSKAETPEPGPAARTDLFSLLLKDMVKTAGEMGLKEIKPDDPDIGGWELTYGNDCFNVSLYNGSSMIRPIPIEMVSLEKDPNGLYSVDGFYLGMTRETVEARIKEKPWKFDFTNTYGGRQYTHYTNGKYGLSIHYEACAVVQLFCDYSREW